MVTAVTEPEDQTSEEVVIPLVSETATVTKREVVKDRARIHVLTDTVEEIIKAELQSEDVEIRHVPVNRFVEAGEERPQPRTVNGVMIVPVFEEVVVVEKRLLIREEIQIFHHPRIEAAEIPVSLRKQRVSVERLSGENKTSNETQENE